MGGSYDMWQLYAPEGDSGPGALDAVARQRLAAQAAALRRQEQMGTLGLFTGDKVLAPYGQQQLVAARAGAEELTGAPGQRLRQLLQRQQLGAGEEEAAQRALQADPTSAASGTARALLGKFMPKAPVAPTASARELLGVLPLAEKAYQVDENSRNRGLQRLALAGRDAAAVSGYNEEAINALADQWAATGKRPNLGMGKAAVELGGRIATAMTTRHPGVDLASTGANYGADSNSLKKLRQQADAIESFERTALANGDVFMEQARGLGLDVGSPLFNAPYRKFAQQVAGDPKMAAFSAARQTFVQEISKILSGSMGNTAVSDSARHEAEALLSPDASLAQIEAAFTILKKDMANRKAGLAAQLGEIRGRVTGGGQKTEPIAPAAAPGSGPSWTPEKQKRLEELRKKKAEGALQ